MSHSAESAAQFFTQINTWIEEDAAFKAAVIAKVTGDAGTPERLVSFFNAVAEARVAAKPDSGMAPYVGKGGDMVAALAAFKDDAAVQAAGAKLKASMTA